LSEVMILNPVIHYSFFFIDFVSCLKMPYNVLPLGEVAELKVQMLSLA